VEIELGLSKLVLSCLKLAYGKNIMDAGSILCYYNGFECHLVARVELVIVAFLSVMRYLIVCHNITKSTKFWLIWIAIVCSPLLLIFIYGAVLHIDKPTPSYLTCISFTDPGKISYIINLLFPFFYLIPCWVITFCYTCIGIKAHKKLNLMKIEAEASGDIEMLKVIKFQRIKILAQLILVVILYNINFSPSYVTHILKFAIEYKRTPIVEAILYFMGILTFTLNPVLTITFQPELNYEITSILFKFNLRIKKFFSKFFQ
jgi:hypothetical protein